MSDSKPEPDKNPDIELYSTKELVTELMNRHDFGIISILKVSATPEGENVILRKWKGNSHTCVGLAHDISLNILNRYRDKERDMGADDKSEWVG